MQTQASSHSSKPSGHAPLLAFTAVAGISQMLWLNFAPLLSSIQSRYGVDELTASLLILVFPAMYVLFSLHAGVVIDRRGYRFTVGAASTAMALAACLRIFDASFAMLLIGQVIIAIAQPYIVNGVSKLVADWYPPEHHGLATGVATIGMFAGMAIALAITPLLVAQSSLQGAMLFFAAISLLAAAAFWIWCREHEAPANHDASAVAHSGVGAALRDFALLLRNRHIALLCVLAFLALGCFNGLTTWLELILGERQVDAESAGLAGGMLILGGIFGSAIVPALSDHFRQRKPFLVAAAAASVALIYPLCTSADFTALLVYGALLGFVFLPGYALLFTMTEEHAGAEHAGRAVGLLMLMGNAGGVVMVLSMETVKNTAGGSWLSAIYLMVAIMALTTLLGLRLRDSLGHGEAALAES